MDLTNYKEERWNDLDLMPLGEIKLTKTPPWFLFERIDELNNALDRYFNKISIILRKDASEVKPDEIQQLGEMKKEINALLTITNGRLGDLIYSVLNKEVQ